LRIEGYVHEFILHQSKISYNEDVKKIFFAILAGLLIGTSVYVLKNMNIKKIAADISQSKIYVQKDENANFMADWTTEGLLKKISDAREASGASRLNDNAKLDQAAKSRLSVILTDKDIDGSVTGLTREKALTNAGYKASMVGELILTSFYKTNDPIAFWNSNTNYIRTLYQKDFQDVGIAIKNGEDKVDIYILLVSPQKTVNKTQTISTTTSAKITWGGPELWTAINKRRVELGVNPLKQMELLCTVASIRLNELLELGKLDGHEGFVPVLERSDLKDQTEKYNISEFLIQGYPTPDAAVAAWENTMGHKALLAGGEYVWGCVYAQNTFGVAIAAY
jgi:uncharacterized protein YkwD